MSARHFNRFAFSVIGMGLALLVGFLLSTNALTSHAESPVVKTVPAKKTPEPAAKKPVAEDPNAQELSLLETERFAKLETLLTGATLVGHSTTTGGKATKLDPDRYELASVKHVGNGRWLFQARIRYGENDITVPLTLPIHWAGDTPVITVDNMGVPGLGTYTARVMIYADHYAGFWSGGDHGGHLFGVVARTTVEKNP